MRKYPFGVWLGVAFSTSLAVSAIYWNAARISIDSGASWGTVASVNAEYRAAADKLALPPGMKWPATTPYEATFENGEGIAYGKGAGTQWAEPYWFDAWASVATSSAVPAADRMAAIRRLSGFFGMTAFKYMPVAEQARFRKMVSEAQAGDSSELRDYVGSVEQPSEGGAAGE